MMNGEYGKWKLHRDCDSGADAILSMPIGMWHLFVTVSELLGNGPLIYLLIEGLSRNGKKNSKKDSNSQRTEPKSIMTKGNVIQSVTFDFHEIGADHFASQIRCYSIDLLR
jgi:hypothetical protein